MKVSILSFTKVTNFGASLQCYALCKTLKDFGHEVNIIDIQLKRYKMPWYSLLLRFPMVYLFYRFRKKHLNYFTRRFKSVDDLKHYCPQSDLFIVGSDQVWNPDITNRLDPLVYFFSFLPASARRISYAASFGSDSWEHPELSEDVNSLLHKFNAISVREDSGVEICKKIFNIDARLVLDPTLLISSYDDICGVYNPIKETNELIYYTFVHDQAVQKILADYAKARDYKAVVLRSNRKYPGFTRKLYVSVPGWLNSIRYSQMVVTTSFHCMVFCIIFHKKFVIVPGKTDRSTRHKSLLNQLGLSDCYCGDISELNNKLEYVSNLKVDYSMIDAKINLLREDSIRFLNSCC